MSSVSGMSSEFKEIVANDGFTFSKHREDFPMLKEKLNGLDFCYLNTAATSLKPYIVINSVSEFYSKLGVSASRGADNISYQASVKYDSARKKVADFISAESAKSIVFTRGTTASINMICRSLEDSLLDNNSEIIVSEQEHHANYVPWQQVVKRKSAKLVIVNSQNNGQVNLEDLKDKLNSKTKLVCLSHQTNVMGALNDIAKIIDIVRQHSKALILIDGAQGVIHERINVKDLDVDFYTFSAHKMFGPTGIGCFYAKLELLEKMPPVEMGGEMIETVNLYDTSFAELPSKFEAGTMMYAEAVGFETAIDYINNLGFDKIQEQISITSQYALEQMRRLDNVEIYNQENVSKSGIITFNIKNTHPHDAASVYDQAGISLRAGHHCAQRAMAWLKQSSTLRASISFYNTKNDIDRFIECTKKAGDYFDILF